MMKDLPKMYQHYKEAEDPNPTILDFFAEHLVDIDKIFDKGGDENTEKEHQQLIHQIINYCVQLTTPQQVFIVKQSYFKNIIIKRYSKYQINYSFIFNSEILHPPIA